MKKDQKRPAIHDGQRVRDVLSQMGISHREFNRRMGWPSRRVEYQLKKAHWTTDELERAGEVLGFNFFVAYTVEKVERLLGTIAMPVDALVDPRLMDTLRGEVLSLADRIRRISGD